jgi:GntP family gluconate:H+ symporter
MTQTLISIVGFFGNKNTALVIGGIAALMILASRKKDSKEGISSTDSGCFK